MGENIEYLNFETKIFPNYKHFFTHNYTNKCGINESQIFFYENFRYDNCVQMLWIYDFLINFFKKKSADSADLNIFNKKLYKKIDFEIYNIYNSFDKKTFNNFLNILMSDVTINWFTNLIYKKYFPIYKFYINDFFFNINIGDYINNCSAFTKNYKIKKMNEKMYEFENKWINNYHSYFWNISVNAPTKFEFLFGETFYENEYNDLKQFNSKISLFHNNDIIIKKLKLKFDHLIIIFDFFKSDEISLISNTIKFIFLWYLSNIYLHLT